MRALSRPWLILLALSLGVALLLLVDAVPLLRGGFGWQWPYDPVSPVRVVPLLAAMAVYVAGAWALLRHRQQTRWLLIWSFAGVVALSLAGLWLRADDVVYELFIRTASGVTTGQHLAGAEIDWSDPAWLNWPQTVEPFVGRSGHIVLSGPALPLWYGALNTALDQVPAVTDPLHRALIVYQCRNYALLAYSPAQWTSAWFGMLMPVWAGLAVILLHAITRRLVDDDGQAARLAVAWWPLVPALVLFTPTWNTVYPLGALVAFWLLLRGLQGGAGWLVASGLVAGLLIFANFSMVPLLGLFGFYTLLHDLWLRRRGLRRPIVAGLWFGLGLAAPWVMYWLLSGLSPLDLLDHAMANHLILDRPYLPWLWLHSWEWALLTGLPLIALWLVWALRRKPDNGGVLALALLLTMLVLVISGTARGETGRVWLFFAPFVLISAAASLNRERAARGWLLISTGQAALLVAVAGTWLLINAPDMNPPPQTPGPVTVAHAAQATFGEDFRLVGWEAQAADDHLTLHLNWQPLRQMTTPYWFAALLVAPDGSLPQDTTVWQALDTRYPTTCWQPGEIVGEVVRLPLPDQPMPGEWWISLAAFADESQLEQRLAVSLPEGTTDDQIGLGPVHIP